MKPPLISVKTRVALAALSLLPLAGGCAGRSGEREPLPPHTAPPPGESPVNVPPQPSPAAQGTYIGTLRGGIMAIGGESTGWMLQGTGDERGGGLDVDVSSVRDRAEELEGQPVTIRGRIEERRYVERGAVKVLIAESINPREE